MAKIDVHEIAINLINLHSSINSEEITQLVNERFNGKQIPFENLPNEIINMVSELIGKTREQDLKFMIDLVQSVVDELHKDD